MLYNDIITNTFYLPSVLFIVHMN